MRSRRGPRSPFDDRDAAAPHLHPDLALVTLVALAAHLAAARPQRGGRAQPRRDRDPHRPRVRLDVDAAGLGQPELHAAAAGLDPGPAHELGHDRTRAGHEVGIAGATDAYGAAAGLEPALLGALLDLDVARAGPGVDRPHLLDPDGAAAGRDPGVA